MSELQTGQQEIFDYVKNNLGEGMIDVELDPKHYQTALERAINKFRQRSSNACLLYTSPSPRDRTRSRMPSSA